MARTLYLLRHAKAGHDDPALEDIDRPLTERGRREAMQVAWLMVTRQYGPTRILCSISQRTRETLVPILAVLAQDAAIELTRSVYDASADALLGLIRDQPHEAEGVMLIGHNPGLEKLARSLAGSGDDKLLSRLRTMFPPAALVAISFDAGTWSDTGPGTGRLAAFEVPD